MKGVSSFRFIYTGIEIKSNRIECFFVIFFEMIVMMMIVTMMIVMMMIVNNKQTNARVVVSLLLSLPCAYPPSFFKYYEYTYLFRQRHLSILLIFSIKDQASSSTSMVRFPAPAWWDFLLSDRHVSTANVEMCSCCTRGHLFLFDKKTCLLVVQEHKSACAARRHVCFL